MIIDQVLNTSLDRNSFGASQSVGDIASLSMDSDAVVHINNVLAINGAEVTQNERIALSILFKDLKQIGVFNPENIPVLCPIIGRVNAACSINYMNATKPLTLPSDIISNEFGLKNNHASATRQIRVNEGQLTWGLYYTGYSAGFNITQLNINNSANGKVSYTVAGNNFRHYIDTSVWFDLGSFFNTFSLLGVGRIVDNFVYVRNNRNDFVLSTPVTWGSATFNYYDIVIAAQGFLSVFLVVKNVTEFQYKEVGNALLRFLILTERYRA